MNKKKTIITIFVIILMAIFVFGARSYYSPYGHMRGGMHGQPYMEKRGAYETYGHGMMGPGMMNFSYGMMRGNSGCSEITDYYLYNKGELNLSKTQIETLNRLRNNYYEENLELRTKLYEKNFELQNLLFEEKINLSKAESLINEVATIRAKLRYNGIESFTKARNVLTEEQKSQLNSKGFTGHMR